MSGTVYQEPQASPPPAPRRRPPRPNFLIAIAAAAILAVVLLYVALRPNPQPAILGAGTRSIALSENGKLLAVATLDGNLRLVAAESGHTLAHIQLPAAATAASFGPGDTVLVLARDRLLIFASNLASHTERQAQPNSTDMVWSPALQMAIVSSGGADRLHPSLEFFPAQPLGLAQSTSQFVDLVDWAPPLNLAVSGNGLIVAVTLATARRANVIFYDSRLHRVTGSSLVSGRPEGVALNRDGNRAWVVSPASESIIEIGERSSAITSYPKSASTSPLRMIVVNEAAGNAYTTGAPTFPEVSLDQRRITRTFELPTNSAGIALSEDGNTAYLTFRDANKIGVLNVQDMKSYREITLR